MKNRSARFAAAGALTLLSVLLTSPVSAQAVARDPDALGASVSVSFATSGKTDLEFGQTGFGSVRVDDYAVAIEQELGEGMSIGIGYERHDLSVGSGVKRAPLPNELQSLSANLKYLRPFNERWTGMLFVSPGYHFAGSRIASKGFGVTTGLLALHKYSDTLSWSLGVGYDSLARDNLSVLPIGGVEWKFAPDWTLSVGFPRTALTYDVSSSLQLALTFEGNYGNYYVREDPQPGATTRPWLNKTPLEYSEGRGGLSATYKFSPSLALTATVGSTFERRFNYHERNFKLKTDDVTVYGSLGCTFSF